ncbi:PAS domain-containing sensor histidine kinase [Chelativorans sp.]|uniref:PAS domain-containing sensor histidine kinase n=1 Tax=Chelativorans sp. TaxID=2203393 RepID=UPI0028117EC4|nr:PAS domain-containing sensor histidine kinase [Chelativorans sp.]
MSTKASLPVHLPQGLKAACARLLHPSVTGGEERARQLRLVEVLLAGAVLAALATAEVAVRRVGAADALASIALVFGIGLLAPFALITTAKRRMVEPLALSFGAICLGLLLAAGGGLASPLAAMSAALALESAWVGRSRRAIGFGIAAAAAALAIGAALPAFFSIGISAASAWQWMVPLAYALTILARLPLVLGTERREAAEEPAPALEDIIGAALLRLQETGEVTSVSGRAEPLLGVAPEMLLGSGFFDRIHVADRVAWLSALSDLREGAEARTMRVRVRVPAEPGIPSHAAYRSFICEFLGKAGEGGFLVMLRDDAATAALEEALASARRTAEMAVLARDQLLASVSHELRTPLNAIVGFSDVLANEMFGRFANGKQREYVELIREAGGHLLSVVNAILDVSKLQSGAYALQTEAFRFEDAVRLCMAMTAQQAEAKSVHLATEIAEDVGTVHCDRRAVQQVLINLLSNAVKFTPAGEVKVSARRCGDRLEFTVSDTGIGISEEDLKRVGKPFMQVRNDYTRQYQGTGLGLALVKGLVRLQGGGLSIESAPGAGTRVHVSLPVLPAEERAEWEAEAAKSGANWNGDWYDDALRKTA